MAAPVATFTGRFCSVLLVQKRFGSPRSFQLENRHIALHGLTVGAGIGTGTTREVDGTAGYKVALPVANGEILAVTTGGGGAGAPIREPRSIVLLATGLASMAWFSRRRRDQ